MKNFIKDNKRWFLFSVFLIIFITACTNYREADGTVLLENQIILGKTEYLDCISEGWFNVFVWPIAQLINLVAKYSDAGMGIIVVTILLNFGIAAMSIKSQVGQQKMQLIQPEMQRIQAKYAGKTDQASRMRMATETQALYKKYDINPFGSIVTMFIQLPIIFAVYHAVMRANAVNTGTFLGINLMKTPMEGIASMNWAIITIFVLMAITQFLSMKLPQILQKRRKAKLKIKTKDYANPKNKKNDNLMGSMNTFLYVNLAVVILFAINWPIGMSFYWLVSSFTRIIQNIVIQKFFIKNM